MLHFLKRLFVKESFYNQTDYSLFNNFDQVFSNQSPIISHSNDSDIFSISIDQHTFYIKRYYKTTGFLSWFGYSRFCRELQNQQWFNVSNIPSANLVAFGKQKFLFKTIKGFLITKGLENSIDLMQLSTQRPSLLKHTNLRLSLIYKTADILQSLHSKRFCHNDLHWRNLLVTINKNDLSVFLIDCPRGFFWFSALLRYKKLKDLANLDKLAPKYFSKTDRLRFMYRYLSTNKLNAQQKTLITAVLKHKEKRLKRKGFHC